MDEEFPPSSPPTEDGTTNYLLLLVRLVLTFFFIPPTNVIGWVTLGVTVRIYNRLTCPHCRSKVSMKGKTVIITGANKGIGLETARDLARRGANVILACRNVISGNMARDDILSTATGKVEVHEIDVSSMASVRKFAKNFQNRKVDVLINNAGVADIPQEITDEGLELTVATNHLGHFLLTHLLMPNLKEASGRILHLTSIGHTWVKNVKELDLENDMKFQYNRPLKTLEIYAATKLFNVLFSNELCRKLQGTGVTSNSVHPGVVDTDIFIPMNSRVWYGFFIKLFVSAYAKSPAEGAQTTIHVAVSEDLKGVSGKYFQDCKEATPSALALDEGLAKKVWEMSERLVQLQPQERTI
ncbi:retinol dehydrogenase 12-like [Macrobrachium nipponense]|uniref:retinol dehydrogenase 12-like n=1 Tax=Macrobrachium nipponense TaxID=159736 RepID=UPI0030C84754